MKLKIMLLVLFTLGVVNAQSGNSVLEKIQNKFKSISDFTADFSQFITEPGGEKGTKISGKFYYKRKNKFIVEMNSSSIISNGESVWNYNQKQKRVIISDFKDDQTSFSLERYIFDYPSLCKIDLVKNQDDGEDEIKLTPNNNDVDFKEAKIWKNSDDMVNKIEITDISGIKYVFVLSTIKINLQLPDSKFNFNPPKGIKIIDLR